MNVQYACFTKYSKSTSETRATHLAIFKRESRVKDAFRSPYASAFINFYPYGARLTEIEFV